MGYGGCVLCVVVGACVCVEAMTQPGSARMLGGGSTKSAEHDPSNQDFDILDLCKEVAMVTEEFTTEYTEDSVHSKSLSESTDKLEQTVDQVLTELNGK